MVVGAANWTSPTSGRTWVASWNLFLGDTVLDLQATVPDQELDTRPTTGVVYWEGSHSVTGQTDVRFDPDTGEQIGGGPVTGDAYVEMTRYDAVAN